MKLIKKVREYTNQKGEKKTSTQFYIVVEGIRPVAIDPHKYGEKGDTYKVLNWLAEYEK